jgi:hypothetical protein
MISLPERIAVVLFGLSFFAFLFYLLTRRPVVFVGFFFIIFTMAWRMSATMFIDLAGPVYSSQLVRDIGPGTASVIHSMAYVVSLIPFLYCFRPAAVQEWCADAEQTRRVPRCITLSDATFALSLVFFAVLFFDLTRHGQTPLFGHIERFAYAGGLAHRWISTYGNFLAFWFGLMFVAGYIRDRRLDFRMVSLLGTMMVYSFLTGSRFSAFYSQTSFFIMPCGAVVALRRHALEGSSRASKGSNLIPKRFRSTATGVAIALTVLVSFAIYNSLVNVRGYVGDEMWNHLYERVLVQPSEIGWVSFERVFLSGQTAPSVVFRYLFQSPIDIHRNTSIQYLMFATIGEPRTTDAILGKFQLAGGFPEIFFELFGPYLAWPFLLGAGCIAAALTAYVIKGALLGRYVSAFLALYLLYGFYVMYIGGMLNFVLPWTYWVKITMFVSVLFAERRLADKGLSLLPWNLLAIPQRKI